MEKANVWFLRGIVTSLALLVSLVFVASMVSPQKTAAVAPAACTGADYIWDGFITSSPFNNTNTHWTHALHITSYDAATGAFAGTGYYIASPSVTWTITGTINGSNINFHFNYVTSNDVRYPLPYSGDGSGTITGNILSNASMTLTEVDSVGQHATITVTPDGNCSTAAPVCSTDAQCGANGVIGSSYCLNGSSYQKFRTFTCSNPGTPSASCGNTVTPQLQQTCTGLGCNSNTGTCDTSSVTPNTNVSCTGSDYLWSGFITSSNFGNTNTTWQHELHINSYNAATGAFTGSGYYMADPSVTWSISGTVNGSNMNFHFNYLTSNNPRFVLPYSGDGSGTINGTITNNATMTLTEVDSVGQHATITATPPSGCNPANTLHATCTTSPNPTTVNQQVTYQAAVTGATANTTYSWSGACVGSSSTCVRTFSQPNTYTSILRVTSGSQTAEASCWAQVNQATVVCTPNASQRCATVNGITGVYNFDSCGNQGSLVQTCVAGCSNGVCQNTTTQNQCSDSADNDNDGKIDSADPGCHFDVNALNNASYEPNFNNEARSNVGQCSDGIDNDNDGHIDTLDSDCHTDGNSNNASSYDGRRNETTQAQQNNLVASCVGSPNPAQVNQAITFTSTATGGTGAYNYQWSTGCSGFGQTCSHTFATAGSYTAILTVTSGNQTQTATCSVNVNQVANIACSTNSQCGTNGVSGNPFCNGNSVYQNYTTFTCNNPGTANSSCSQTVTQQLQNNCGSNQTCNSGVCNTNNNQNITCSSNSQCGTSGITGSPFCSGNSVFQNYTNYTCVNPGTTASSCVTSTTQQVQNICGTNQTCSGNTCININNNNNNNSAAVTKTVRNLSTGNLNYANSTVASPGDILQFSVTVTSNSYNNNYTNTNQSINNVVVRDIFPANLIYNNSLTVDGVANSGNIISGMNIGSLSPNQTRTITYQAQVAPAQNFSLGTTTLTNSVNVTSDSGFTNGSAVASVIVTRSGVLGATTVSTGLTNNPLVDSFFIPLLLALFGIWAYKTGLLSNATWFGSKKLKAKELSSQKTLAEKIAEIKNRELA